MRGRLRITITRADNRWTATCPCGWTYTNTVMTDVAQHATWHRHTHTRQDHTAVEPT